VFFWAETFSLYSISVLTPPIATPWLVRYFIPDWEIVNKKNPKKSGQPQSRLNAIGALARPVREDSIFETSLTHEPSLTVRLVPW
jgi:hypothetical protein